MSAFCEQREGLGVVEREIVDVGPLAGGTLDEVERDLHHVEVAQAEEVHLQEAEVFHPVHLVLGDHRRVFDGGARLGLALDREVLGERLAGDHHRGGVDAVLAAQPSRPSATSITRRASGSSSRSARSSVAIL